MLSWSTFTCMQASHRGAVPDQPQGTVKTAGADPNDPALHGLSNEPSSHSIGGTPHSRGVSPRGLPSFTRGTSFSSTHGSPGAKSSLEQNDSFTHHVSLSRDRSDHEGVELGTMRGSSQNLGEELIAEQLHSFAPGSAHEAKAPGGAGLANQPKSNVPLSANHAHQSTAAVQGPSRDALHGSAAQQEPAAAAASTVSAVSAGHNKAGNRDEGKPASFQSLAALASSHAAARPKQDHQPTVPSQPSNAATAETTAATAAGDGVARGSGERPQLKPASPFTYVPDLDTDTARLHQDRLAQVSTGRPIASDSTGSGTGQHKELLTASGQARASADRPAVLGRPPSEKKWAYPMPTGSPMFERVRSRNDSQEASSPSEAAAERSQLGLPPAGAGHAAARSTGQSAGLEGRSKSWTCVKFAERKQLACCLSCCCAHMLTQLTACSTVGLYVQC